MSQVVLGQGTYGVVETCARKATLCYKTSVFSAAVPASLADLLCSTFYSQNDISQCLQLNNPPLCLPLAIQTDAVACRVTLTMPRYTTDIQRYVLKHGALTGAAFRGVKDQIENGLVSMHRFGVFHSDLSPANILVMEPSGSGPITVVLADFDLTVHYTWCREVNNDIYIMALRPPEVLLRVRHFSFLGLRRAESWVFGGVLHFINTKRYLISLEDQGKRYDDNIYLLLAAHSCLGGSPGALRNLKKWREPLPELPTWMLSKIGGGPDQDMYMPYLQMDPAKRLLVGVKADGSDAVGDRPCEPPRRVGKRTASMLLALTRRDPAVWERLADTRQHCLRVVLTTCRNMNLSQSWFNNVAVMFDVLSTHFRMTPRLALVTMLAMATLRYEIGLYKTICESFHILSLVAPSGTPAASCVRFFKRVADAVLCDTWTAANWAAALETVRSDSARRRPAAGTPPAKDAPRVLAVPMAGVVTAPAPPPAATPASPPAATAPALVSVHKALASLPAATASATDSGLPRSASGSEDIDSTSEHAEDPDAPNMTLLLRLAHEVHVVLDALDGQSPLGINDDDNAPIHTYMAQQLASEDAQSNLRNTYLEIYNRLCLQ